MKTIKVVAAVIKKQNKVFVTQRGYGEFKDGWEFPGGKIEPGESGEQALIREIQEELETTIIIEEFFMNVNYKYPTFILDMDCYLCTLKDNHIKLNDHNSIRWISLDEQNINWIPADIQIFDTLKKRGILHDTNN